MIERINFASEQFGDLDKPGVRAIVDRIAGSADESLTPEQYVDLCLDQLGALSVSNETRDVLVRFAERVGRSREGVAQTLRLAASTKEFQQA
jgi:hypothetical protein